MPEDDGYFPIDAKSQFFDPLPQGLEIGYFPQQSRNCQERLSPAGKDPIPEMESMLEALERFPAVDHRKHMRDIVAASRRAGPLLKRPATPEAVAQPLKGAAGALLKRPAAAEAVAKPPKRSKLHGNAEDGAAGGPAGLLKQCVDHIERAAPEGHRGARADLEGTCATVSAGMQRTVYIALIRAKQAGGKTSTVCSVSDRQFATKETTLSASDVLKDLWNLGATRNQLQFLKNSGLLYGVSCGVAPNWS